ncbi:hypothetical protein [Luteococcus japonicus]|uniref:Uncharacterized protein n=1 Tax=Luteococcus japonicus LSP_Lj1 TaxID=1255658 RepID=A0A1R4J9Z9_9ACTN|nr:hypothetical protein [Luteococcus japonicus]SJN28764.1 hypothetical protein FM114_06340 [Luteococcus japonicus LSP_Lj1]
MVDPKKVFKKSDDFEGPLLTLKKGAQVKWRKSMCAPCNNTRSQPFDMAYDAMETFLVDHADQMSSWRRLAWTDVYGTDWEQGAADLGRYFAKQMCCMLATQQLPIPDDLIAFLDGAPRCPSVAFTLCRNWRTADLHRILRRDGRPQGATTIVGLLTSTAYQRDGQFSGLDYGYRIGYVQFSGDWSAGSDRVSWWESPEVDLPLVGGGLRGRVDWSLSKVRLRLAGGGLLSLVEAASDI